MLHQIFVVLMWAIGGFIFGTVILVVLSGLLPTKGKWLFCHFYGWHNGKGSTVMKFDGASWHSTCARCGKHVMQDSQGNWF